MLLRSIFRVLLWLAARPSRGGAFRIAKLLSYLLHRSNTANTTRINLAACFPQLTVAQREALTHNSLHHMVMLFFELAQLRYWPLEKLLANIEVEGEEVVQRAFATQQGTLLLVPHLGNWELMCVYLGHHYSVAALYERPKQGGIEEEIKIARERFEGKMFAIGVGGMRSVLKELRNGGLVAILPDQVPDYDGGVYANFFGQPALTMTLPHQLQTKTNATMVLGSVSRKVGPGGFTGYRLEFSELACEQEDPSATSEAINAAIETVVRREPAQYQWEYKRFKRPPNREPGFYK